MSEVIRPRDPAAPFGGVGLARVRPAPTVERGARRRSVPPWLRPVLRAPLSIKLAGANGIVVATAALVLWWHNARGGSTALETLVLALALAVGVLLNWVLVRLALWPLHELEETADRVWRGDLGARVPRSVIADEDVARLGGVVNRLLDGLAADRSRMRELASQAIASADDERARIARELHDSVAQTLAALALQVSAAARDSNDPELAERLTLVRQLVGDTIEEVRALSHSVHPRVLDDLGLAAALEWLARQTRDRSSFDVRVAADAGAARAAASAPKAVASALYRVAQEALRNVERHAGAREATLTLAADGHALRLVVQDDGAGFDVAEATARRPGMGLASMRERMALVDGTFDVESAAGRGTRIAASAPLDSSPDDATLL